MENRPNTTAGIDYTLRQRRDIREAFVALAQTESIAPVVLERQLKELVTRNPQVPFVLLSLLGSSDRAILSLLSIAFEMMDDPKLVRPLLDRLRDPSLSELAKLHILPVLEYYEVDLEDDHFVEVMMEAFGDLEHIAQWSTVHMLEEITGDDETLSLLLENFHEMPSEARLAFVQQFGETQDERAVRLLSLLARTTDIPAASEAARYLGRIRSPRSAEVIESLLTEPHPPEVTAQLRRSLQRLSFVSILPVEEPVEHLSSTPIHQIFCSPIDGDGYRVLWLTRKKQDQEEVVSAISLMLNSHMGIRDCFGAIRMSAEEFDEIMHSMADEAGRYALGYEYALLLVRDALWQNHHRSIPLPAEFALWRGLLGDQELAPQSYSPNWDALGLLASDLQPNEERVAQSRELPELEAFASWLDHSAATYDYCEEMMALMKYHKGAALEERLASLMAQYAADVFEAKRTLIRRNLELTADLLWRLGEPSEHVQIALAAATHLRDESVAIHHHPLIQRIMEESLQLAAANLVHGFDVRLEQEFSEGTED